MITPATWKFGESMRAFDQEIVKWKNYFISKDIDYTEGFMFGWNESISPFGKWFRKYILAEMDARILGAKKALEELKK